VATAAAVVRRCAPGRCSAPRSGRRRARCYHGRVTAPGRFQVVAALPAVAGWVRRLAVDAQGGAPRAVVLALAPAAHQEAARLAALVRDAEAAARVRHPNVVPALGLETLDDGPALVEAHPGGVSLRALLDAAGRLPPDLAARVASDACAGVAALHRTEAEPGVPLVHGALEPGWIAIGPDGAALVGGAGAGGEGGIAADVRALAALLHECLAGEPPGPEATGLDQPGIPPALAEVARAALAAPGSDREAAGALGAAIVAALPLADRAAVAAYAEAILPEGEGARAEMRARLAAATHRPAPSAPGAGGEAPSAPPALPPSAGSGAAAPAAAPAAPPAEAAQVSDDLIVGEAEPQPDLSSPGAPVPTDAAIVFPRPAPRPRRSWLPLAVALVLGAMGFAVGLGISRAHRPVPPAAPPVAAAPSEPEQPPAQAAPAPAASPAPGPAPAAPEPRPARRADARPSLAISAAPPADVYVDGKRAGRAPVTVAVAAGEHEVRLHDAAQGIDVRRKVVARGAATPVRFALGRGQLDVTAPEEAEVFVDGRRSGKGSLKLSLWEGPHRIEVRLGRARAQERFTLAPGETWTYAVTPSP